MITSRDNTLEYLHAMVSGWLGFTRTGDEDTLYSLGGVFDAPIFIFYRNDEPITQFAHFRG